LRIRNLPVMQPVCMDTVLDIKSILHTQKGAQMARKTTCNGYKCRGRLLSS